MQQTQETTTTLQNPPESQKEVVLKVENVSKKFCRNLKRSMFYGIKDLAKGMVGVEPDTTTLRKDEFWALKDINFELREGEILGIIGVNGSGKSTLLRVLTGIFPPDKGRIWMDGTVGGIIALGAGMHPHMTGRENIYLNGTVLGMSKEEIDNKFDDIVEFSEIGEFLDAPFSTYSSGMKVRLGFAVAVHCEPEILLIDEVLAVGDLSFRNKSMNKMMSYVSEAKSLIYISHNVEQIRNMCSKVLVLHEGDLVFSGNTDKAINYYTNLSNEVRKNRKSKNDDIVIDSDFIKYLGVNYIQNGINVEKIKSGDELEILIKIKSVSGMLNVIASVNIAEIGSYNVILSDISNDFKSNKTYEIDSNDNTIKLKYNNFNLKPGLYSIGVVLKDSVTHKIYLRERELDILHIVSDNTLQRGAVLLESEWE